MSNKVVLNAVPIIIEGRLTEQQVSPWSSKMSMGNLDFPDYQPASVRGWRDLRGGIGKDTEEEETNRISWSESCELTKSQCFTLGALRTVLGAFTTPMLLGIDFEGYSVFFGNAVVMYNNAGTLTAADTTNHLSTPTDCIVFTDGTDSYLIYCNGADVRYTTNPTSASWSALSTSDVKFMCAFDKRLIGVNSTGTTIFYSARDNCDDAAGGAMSSFAISGPWTAAYDIWEGKAFKDDTPVIYMLTDIGVVTIDFWARVAYMTDVTFPKTANAMKGCYWNASIIASNGAGISKATSGTFTDNWGPDDDDGLPADYIGYIYDMKALNHWLAIAVSGGTKSTILKRHSTVGGWHEIYSSSDNMRALHHSNLTTIPRLYFGEANNICYVEFPDVTNDLSKVAITRAASSEFILPRLSKFTTLPKVAVEIQALTEDCDIVTSNHNEKIEIYMRKDDTTSWGSAVGTFSTNGRPSPVRLGATAGQGVSFYDLQLKVKLYRGTADTTATPKLKALALFYKPIQAAVLSWTFHVAARGEEAKRIITDLASAKSASTLISFYPDGDTTSTRHWVQIETMPTIHELEGIGKEQLLTVVVTEIMPYA